MIGTPVGQDHEVGLNIRKGRFDQDMDPAGSALPARGVTDDPPNCIASGDVDELFAWLKRNRRDFFGTGIKPIQRSFRPRVDLDRVDVSGPGRLHSRCLVGLGDRLLGRQRLVLGDFRRKGLQLAGQRQDLGRFNNRNRLRRICLRKPLLECHLIIGRLKIELGGASAKQKREGQCARRREYSGGKGIHFASPIRSRDQLREWT